jgi:hypothetical protein
MYDFFFTTYVQFSIFSNQSSTYDLKSYVLTKNAIKIHTKIRYTDRLIIPKIDNKLTIKKNLLLKFFNFFLKNKPLFYITSL